MSESRWRELFAFTRRLGLAPEVKLRAEARPLAPRVRVVVRGGDLAVGDETAPLESVEWVRVPLFVVDRREGRVRDRSAEVESLLAAAGIPYVREAAAVVVHAGR
ncbi:MAG TPA: hypothetical protein VF406_01755 [Thermodesulfobacteriota bacterium]